MVWQAVAGSTFLLRTGPGGKEHLYFVLNDPMAFEGLGSSVCVTVNASTPHDRCDRSCMLPAGCHPFITHESYVFCSRAQVYPAAELERRVNQRHFGSHEPIPLDLVKHILAGLIRSDHTTDDVRDACTSIFDAMVRANVPAKIEVIEPFLVDGVDGGSAAQYPARPHAD